MSLLENIILNQVRRNLNKALDLSNVAEIAADNSSFYIVSIDTHASTGFVSMGIFWLSIGKIKQQ